MQSDPIAPSVDAVESYRNALNRIGERLRIVRERQGLNMTIALEIRDRYRVAIDPSYMSRMERGKAEIPLRTLVAFARYYRVPLASLVDDGPAGELAGLEYISTDPALGQLLALFARRLGPERARRKLETLLIELLDLAGEKPPSVRKPKAARKKTAGRKKTAKPGKSGKGAPRRPNA